MKKNVTKKKEKENKKREMLWFAFILVSLKYRKHRLWADGRYYKVVICFHFSIFEVSETSQIIRHVRYSWLWFAFILVSLKYRKHLSRSCSNWCHVVICFHFSIFEVSETSRDCEPCWRIQLWFAFILVSLKYRKHPLIKIDL